jgi:hypothetical protein
LVQIPYGRPWWTKLRLSLVEGQLPPLSQSSKDMVRVVKALERDEMEGVIWGR